MGDCTKYYQVTDPTTGKVYYTSKLDTLPGGATSLRDARTGDQVSVQNSDVKEISKEEFESGKSSSGSAAAPTTRPAAK